MTLAKFRAWLYLLAKGIGDVRAVQTNTVPRRIARRIAGKATGRALGKLFR